MASLAGKTLLITGASRGIGLAIALRAARDGANIVIAAKTAEPHPKLPGTIHTAAEAVEKAGGHALPCVVDVRFEEQIQAAVEAGVERFGGIDVCVNNASAIDLRGVRDLPMKRYDLMHAVNGRGTYLATKLCLPHLERAENPHVLNLCPPAVLKPEFFRGRTAYATAKFAMSLCVLGMAGELSEAGVAVNGLWPRTTIATAAVANLLGGKEMIRRSRKPDIVADAAYAILTRPSRHCTGNFFLDEDVLREEGVTDFRPYQVDPAALESELAPDLFL